MRSTMSSSNAAPTFLYHLFREERYNILRSLSSKRALPHWSTGVNPQDALSSVHTSSTLCAIARSCFTGILFTNSFSVVDESYAGTVCLQGERPAGRFLKEWIQSAGMLLTSLSVDRDLEESLLGMGLAVYYATLSLLEKNCPALRRLYICREKLHPSPKFVNDVLRAIGGRLHDLFAWDTSSPEIANHCAGLRSTQPPARE